VQVTNNGSQPPTTGRIAALLVTAGEQLCAVTLEHVGEIMRPQPTRPFASPFGFLEGIAIIRGAPVPVVRLASLLGHSDVSRPGRLVTLKLGTRSVALAVGSVRGVCELEPSLVAELPPLFGNTGSSPIEHLVQLDGEFVLVLRAARIVPEELWARLDAAGAAS
jgi:purine-binding chemotaxis protein CheW